MSASPATILVVNDEPTQLCLASRLLEKSAFQVRGCRGAMEALELLDTGWHCDLIVTDVSMPGIDGWRFCRLLRTPLFAALNKTPVLVVSATYSGMEAKELTAELGANAFLSFPYKAEVFLKCVRDLLDGRGPQVSPQALLVVESGTQAEELRRALESEGYAVHLSHTGGGARRLFHEHAPEVVVLDTRLPGLESGELLQEVKRNGSNTVAIAITGNLQSPEVLALFRQGADGYVCEPFTPGGLVDLCKTTRRERALLRIGELLDERVEELRRSGERFRALFEAIPEAVFVHDACGTILHLNAVGARWLERSGEDLVGRKVREIIEDADVAAPWRSRNGRGDDAACFEAAFVTGTGRTVQAEVSQCAIDFEDRPALLSVARDVTERKRLEHEILESRKLKSLGTLASGVAHEFNNILAGVVGYSEILAGEAEPDSMVKDFASKIIGLGQRAAALISQLMAFSEQTPSKRRPLQLEPLVDGTVRMLRRTIPENIDIQLQASEPTPMVSADLSQMQQVIMNLATNARDAMPSGGSLRFSLEDLRLDDEAPRRHASARKGRYVVLSVQDRGAGMTQEVREQAFDPFFTTKDVGEGTGLGLTAVHGIVESHGGFLTVSSEIGRGSEFRVHLPAIETPAPSPEVQNCGPHSGGATILLVEDEPAVLDTAREMLKFLGYGVLTARDGSEALEVYRSRQTEIDLVMTDVMMPQMGGEELYQSLTDTSPGVKVIMMSACSLQGRMADPRFSGLKGYLQKPFELGRLREVLRCALEEEEPVLREVPVG